MIDRCENCAFFNKPKKLDLTKLNDPDDPDLDPYRNLEDNQGLCQRYPPKKERKFRNDTGFPVVAEDSGCGEYQ